ncbi:MAG: cytochrome c oxidase assembly protein [Gammaproteobacteria bacterium]|nr:cytochrome c oxidase assembly protein [Gammaproteobacteria bacterium]MDH5629479.1 cytochrome c oxidase assembly protein [Gammaproteobacteria bacterium]
MSEQDLQQANKLLVKKLLAVVAGMFVFVYALIPLYDVFCDITGLNGKTRGKALYESVSVDDQREITIEFMTNVNRGMPWEFGSKTAKVKVHPGELNEVIFYAKNRSGEETIGQTVPSVSPGQAALYLNKTECFCFDKQVLQAGEYVDMPMKFYIDPDLPEEITHLTLSYKLYNITEAVNSATGATK